MGAFWQGNVMGCQMSYEEGFQIFLIGLGIAAIWGMFVPFKLWGRGDGD